MDPHRGLPVVSLGPPPAESDGVVIVLHGRNAAPANALDLGRSLDRPTWTFLAPTAANRTWYPLTFLAPTEQNEPYLSSALSSVDRLVREVLNDGIRAERIVMMGFSQGACLATEFVYRNPRRYGGLVAFSGGLIGPPGTAWNSSASFRAMPVFLGCSDVDAHVPKVRVNETAQVFDRLHAMVDERIYPGMGHLVIDDEIEAARAILDAIAR